MLEDEAPIARALEVGKEWLGEDHPAVASLKVGVAIHHGRLPSPFLRELELLLSEGALKVIVASPTLSQGLNLNAAVLLVPALYRASEKIKGEEFASLTGTLRNKRCYLVNQLDITTVLIFTSQTAQGMDESRSCTCMKTTT
ncbi:hypothetical protein [Proteus vulgaris]|uniref:hypothetical protein n=1 Tax=Proteus vulgaris TaxID=585 RepID=UPI0021001E0F|nr:hypothetical protein [Proteus vulgaris]